VKLRSRQMIVGLAGTAGVARRKLAVVNCRGIPGPAPTFETVYPCSSLTVTGVPLRIRFKRFRLHNHSCIGRLWKAV